MAKADPNPAPAAEAAKTAANRALVTEMFQRLFVEGRILEEVEKYLSRDFIEHDPNATNGIDGLRAFFTNSFKRNPNQSTDMKFAIVDGDLAMVYFHFKTAPEDRGRAGADIFRIANGKIVEHWGVGQLIQSAGDLARLTPSFPDKTAANRTLVKEMFQTMFVEMRAVSEADKYIAKDFIEHNPNATNGVEGIKAYFTNSYKQYPKQSTVVKRIIVDGDAAMVHFHFKRTPEERGVVGVDIFRIANGKIAEHWDLLQQIPDKSMNQNTIY